jgi:hypothetical protein
MVVVPHMCRRAPRVDTRKVFLGGVSPYWTFGESLSLNLVGPFIHCQADSLLEALRGKFGSISQLDWPRADKGMHKPYCYVIVPSDEAVEAIVGAKRFPLIASDGEKPLSRMVEAKRYTRPGSSSRPVDRVSLVVSHMGARMNMSVPREVFRALLVSFLKAADPSHPLPAETVDVSEFEDVVHLLVGTTITVMARSHGDPDVLDASVPAGSTEAVAATIRASRSRWEVVSLALVADS